MLDAGLRPSEPLDLTIANARLQEGFLKVAGKVTRSDSSQSTGAAKKLCEPGLSAFAASSDPDVQMPYVFLNANGCRMTLRSLEEMIGRTGKAADIAGLHPHRLRHTFATGFLTLGLGDTFQLQQLLGHTSLEMVRRYDTLPSPRFSGRLWRIARREWTD